MTNFIEQMMKTAGVEPEPVYSEVWADEQIGVYYPDFTAEKQLEIIKLIGLERGFKVIRNEGYDYILAEDMYIDDQYNKQGYSMIDFTQALAQLTTELMNAGELDKEKVREVLEG